MAAVLVALVAVGVVAQTSRRPDEGFADAPPNLATPSLQDRPAPDNAFPLPLEQLEPFGTSAPVDVSSLLERPLVINFWASWCVPCVREMPEWKRASDQLDGRVTFLGVDVMDAPVNAEPFIERLGIDYLLASDPKVRTGAQRTVSACRRPCSSRQPARSSTATPANSMLSSCFSS